jgi:hypothetical protein
VEMVQALFGDMIMIVLFILVAAAVMKVFQMASDMRDVKNALLDIKRNTNDVFVPRAPQQAAPAPGPISPEELVRAVHARSYKEDEFPALEPSSPPQS